MKNMMRNCFCCTSYDDQEPKTSPQQSRDFPWNMYTLKELVHATNNFHNDNKIGEGGFGSVYWGRTSKGAELAVKRLKSINAKAEMEFAVEVEILGRVRHKNLLGLKGFYAGGDERLIVYDYMPNHSLLTHLHGQLAADCLLDWPRRMSIAIGSAEGLSYLHHEVTPHIIHRDIKASNVLLDSDFQAKVADFGFAKLIPDGVTHMTTRVKGTLGYLAPEYAMWGKVSESCDVYSFGILLLEILSAKKPLEKLPGGIKRDIIQWATPFVLKDAYDHIADPRLKGRFDHTQLKVVVKIAMACTDSNPENRPSMMEVVEWLKNGVGSRRKDIHIVKDQVDETEDEEDFGNDDTDYYETFDMKKHSGRVPRMPVIRKRRWCKGSIKVDFEKAYNSLSWDYLFEVMRFMGFGDRWCSWIKGLLSSARASVLVNGSPMDEFIVQRGLRQRDPLSPFLFILAMEGLHIAFKRARELNAFSGFRFGAGVTEVSHFFYADDAMFLCDWSLENVEQLAEVIGCGPSMIPFIYLGLPVGQAISVADRLRIGRVASFLRREPRGGVETEQLEAISALIQAFVISPQHDKLR
ncbi:PTI1-like tyrosine-protein kinase [Tanacetum coccineum]